jgi:3-phosphoshikimate 1-carboxyvinyltransferase
MGARIETTDGKPPVTVAGGGLHGVDWDLAVPSAQVKTAILLAGLQAEGRTMVRERLRSRDHTERLLPLFGVPLEVSEDALAVRRQDALRPVAFDVPGDASSAAFLVVAALILPDSEVRIDGVLLNPLRTAFLGVLRAMGAEIRTGLTETTPEPVGWIEARSSRLEGVTVAPEVVPGLIDEVPALAVAAAHARGSFTITGARELRVKESDRIAALAEGLGRMGAVVDEHPDGLTIHGGRRLVGAAVAAQGDHRIAMALAVAALAAQGETTLEDAACASVSFPEFYDLLARGCEQGRRGRA